MSDSPLPGHEVIRRSLGELPVAPGVYRMLDASGQALYVGKAKSLRHRVANYVNVAALPVRLQRMVHATARLEVTLTQSEAEALLLEATLVRSLQPRYNILLRDDKSFPYIHFSADHPFPRIAKYRGARKEAGEYFGPFASPAAVNETIALLQKAFLLRPCSDAFFAQRTRPCLQYQIKRCSAPCVNRISREDYAALAGQARDFLTGKSRAIQQDLERRMEAHSARMEYEQAARLRDRIRALSQVQDQAAQGGIEGEADVVALHRDGRQACIQVFCFRHGHHYGNRSYFPSQVGNAEDGEVMAAFLGQFYQQHMPPPLVYVSHAPGERDVLEEALAMRAGRKVTLREPRKGAGHAFMRQAVKNAAHALRQYQAVTQENEAMMARMQELFALAEPPRRIEVYDNSHVMGTHPVSAMIVAGPEGFRKNAYRKFKMENLDAASGDDYAMMRAVLTRRFRGAEEGAAESWPDLLLIDGGKGQLRAALEVLEEAGVSVPVAAIAKGPDRHAGREKIFLPGRAQPLELPFDDALLHYLQRLRDEAHRFAIEFHRGRRSKAIRQGTLEAIAAVGPKRRKALLVHFGSEKEIRGAGVDDLARVEGISRDLAQRIYDFYHG